MDDAPRSSRLFVTRRLPWILAIAAFAVFSATLNPWIGLQSLRPVVDAAGWSFESAFTQPLHQIFGSLVSALAGKSFPWVANLLTAVSAAGVLYLLARCVALLPHDRRHEERIREPSDIGLLTLPLAWVPPVLASLLLAFQYLFWEHATSYTGEMLDLLLFAWCVRSLLEYRLDRRESRLLTVAFLVGAGIADNWAMIGFAPLFLTAIVWNRGLTFFNLGFLVRLFAAFLLGLAVLLLIPVLASKTGRFDDGFWVLLKGVLGLKKTQLLLLPRGRFLFMSLLMLMPLAAFSIRWNTPSGTGIDRLATTLAWQLLKLLWFAACLVAAFDIGFSPRQMGYGVPLLTFSFCASLAVGYVSGYYLLVGTTQPEARFGRDLGGLGQVVFRGLAGVVVAATVLVPATLIYRNYRVIRAENSRALHDYAMTMLAPLRDTDAFVYSDDAVLASALTAGHASIGATNSLLIVNGRLAPSKDYRQFLAQRQGSRWPGLGPIAAARENVAGLWLSLAVEAARSGRMYFTTPVFSFFAEPFDFRPTGPLQAAVVRRALLETPPLEAELEGVRRFWSEVNPSLEAVIRDRATGASNAVAVGALWSRTANASGVFFQKSGLLSDAARSFGQALLLNPDNAAAKVNQIVNQALAAGKPVPPEAVKAWDGQSGLLDLQGPVDEPEFLRIFGGTLLAQKDDLVRRAAIGFDRAWKLSPTNRYNRFGFITAALGLGDVASATNALNSLRRESATGVWADAERSQLAEVEARVRIALNDLKSAEAPLLEARRLQPQNAEANDLLSYLYLVLGRPDDALAVTVDWENAAPGEQGPLSRRALILLQGGKHAAAAETLTRILDVSPENTLARVNRAISRLMLNQLSEARSDYQRILKDGNDTFQVRFGLAEVARLEKAPAEELKQLERYLELAPGGTDEFTNVVQRIASLRSGR
jgi:tetratricopeptide (TPR) repeat protein